MRREETVRQATVYLVTPWNRLVILASGNLAFGARRGILRRTPRMKKTLDGSEWVAKGSIDVHIVHIVYSTCTEHLLCQQYIGNLSTRITKTRCRLTANSRREVLPAVKSFTPELRISTFNIMV